MDRPSQEGRGELNEAWPAAPLPRLPFLLCRGSKWEAGRASECLYVPVEGDIPGRWVSLPTSAWGGGGHLASGLPRAGVAEGVDREYQLRSYPAGLILVSLPTP